MILALFTLFSCSASDNTAPTRPQNILEQWAPAFLDGAPVPAAYFSILKAHTNFIFLNAAREVEQGWLPIAQEDVPSHDLCTHHKQEIFYKGVDILPGSTILKKNFNNSGLSMLHRMHMVLLSLAIDHIRREHNLKAPGLLEIGFEITSFNIYLYGKRPYLDHLFMMFPNIIPHVPDIADMHL